MEHSTGEETPFSVPGWSVAGSGGFSGGGENDDYWSWHNEAVSKAKKLDACYHSEDQGSTQDYRNGEGREAFKEIKKSVATAMQRAEQSQTPGAANTGRPRELLPPSTASTGQPRASQAPTIKESLLPRAATISELRQEASGKLKPSQEDHHQLIKRSCMRTACCIGVVVLIWTVVAHIPDLKDPEYAKERYLACMKRVDSPSNGNCTHDCLKEVVENGFTQWKMQCARKEDRNTLTKQQALACDCRDLVPEYLKSAEVCCRGNLSLESEPVQRFCEEPQSFKANLIGVFQRYCELNDLPPFAEMPHRKSGIPVLGIAFLGSLWAGLAIAGVVMLLLQRTCLRRAEDSTSYVNLSA